jgi:GT2 family glycosyltransferase
MISVCIATYNGGEMLKVQLESIACQLSAQDEIVISEDGDIAKTESLVGAMGVSNVRIVEGARVGSPIYNFENCIKQAKGEIIFLSDQDDKWLPGKVKCMVDALQDADCVCSDCIVTDGDFKVTNDSFYALLGTKSGKYFNLLQRNCYLGCCMAFRREILKKVLPFPKNLPMHDIWIGNIAAFYYRMKFIDDKLILFRRHGKNSSSTASKSPYNVWKKIEFRVQIIKDLLLAYNR